MALFLTSSIQAQTLKKGERIPFETVTTIFGEDISLQQGRTVVAFYRNVDCAMCNLRIHQLTEKAHLFNEKDIRVIIVLQSTADEIKAHLGDAEFPFDLIADPNKKLFDAIGAKSGGLKTLFAMRRIGSIVKIKKQKIPLIKDQRGDTKLAPVELILDKGTIIKAHYGSDIGDHISIKQLLKAFEKR